MRAKSIRCDGDYQHCNQRQGPDEKHEKSVWKDDVIRRLNERVNNTRDDKHPRSSDNRTTDRACDDEKQTQCVKYNRKLELIGEIIRAINQLFVKTAGVSQSLNSAQFFNRRYATISQPKQYEYGQDHL